MFAPHSPKAPEDVVAISGDEVLTLLWEPPANDNGHAVSAYAVRYKQSTDTDWTDADRAGDGTTRQEQIDMLDNGVEYDLQVAAVNAGGLSAWTEATSTPSRDLDLYRLPNRASPTSRAIWSDGATLYVTGDRLTSVIAYGLRTGVHDADKSFDGGFTSSETAQGLWVQGNTMWISRRVGGRAEVQAYTLDGARVSGRDIDPAALSGAGVVVPVGLWSDGTTMWIVDALVTTLKVRAFSLADSAHDADRDIDLLPSETGIGSPFDIWSDGDTMWVADTSTRNVAAFSMHTRQRVPARDIDADISRTDIRGLWSDGDTMWLSGILYTDDADLFLATARDLPDAVAPAVPDNVAAKAADESLVVTWESPGNDGGRPVDEFAVRHKKATDPDVDASWTTVTHTDLEDLSVTVTRLENGIEYDVSVRASNSVDDGAWSMSVSVTPVAVPDPPTAVTAAAGDTSAVVSWTEPTDTGSDDITGYTVTASPDGATCSTTGALSCAVSGLTNGTPYTFTVTAANRYGDSVASAASAAVIPGPLPGAPTAVTAAAGDELAVVSWTEPTNTGGSAIVFYTVTASPGSATCTTTGALSCAVSGLTNGTPYTFTVTAANEEGRASVASAASAAVTPGPVPGAPTAVTATAGDQSAAVSWTAPTDTGGSAITAYTVAASPGSATCATTGAVSCTVSGLTNGTPYTFTVTAANGDRVSVASAASVAVTPGTAPGAPTAVTATAGDQSAAVSWSAPTDTGGSAIAAYAVSASPGSATCTTTGTRSCTVSGLTNGTPYTFTVTAANGENRVSVASAASTAVTPGTAPDAPTAVTAAAGDQSAVVSWAAPTDTGGSAIAAYTVTADPGGATCTTSGAVSCTVSGLTNGTPYTFTVTAANGENRVSAASAASTAVTPGTAPDAPTAVTAAAGDQSAAVSWSAPTDTGGSNIAAYAVTASPGSATCTTTGARSCTVSGLTNGTPYTFTVTAANGENRVSAASAASAAVTPGRAPGAPTAVTATAGDESAAVSWTEPGDTGGADVSGYTVTASPGSETCTTTGARSCMVSGLVNGTPYTFTVTAANRYGTSSASAASVAVTPGSAPDPPTAVTATAGDESAVVSWSAPTDTGGSNIAGYTVTAAPGGATCTTTGATSCTVSGLVTGTVYRFTVTATNSEDRTSAASTASVPVTVQGKPGPPTAVTAIQGNASAAVSWDRPVDIGGSPITGYTVTASPGSATCTTTGTLHRHRLARQRHLHHYRH